MGSKSSRVPGATFGFYELGNDGTVKYSRTRTDASEAGGAFVGENFFEVAGFANCEDLRRRFRSFVGGDLAAESFIFDCFFDNAVARTKVTLTRAFETDKFQPEKIVMLDIRQIDG